MTLGLCNSGEVLWNPASCTDIGAIRGKICFWCFVFPNKQTKNQPNATVKEEEQTPNSPVLHFQITGKQLIHYFKLLSPLNQTTFNVQVIGFLEPDNPTNYAAHYIYKWTHIFHMTMSQTQRLSCSVILTRRDSTSVWSLALFVSSSLLRFSSCFSWASSSASSSRLLIWYSSSSSFVSSSLEHKNKQRTNK